jgi:phage protein D
MSSTLYVSSPLVEIEGADPQIMDAFKRDILQIAVEESLHLPGMFTIVVNHPYASSDSESKPWRYDDLLQMGKTVKLGFVASTTQAAEFDEAQRDYILEGEITAIETHFTSNTQAPIVVRGYDISHRLHRGRHNRSFQNRTDSDIIGELAEEAGIAAQVHASGKPHDYVFQENQTNMEFMRERAARIGFELFVQNGKLHFRPPSAGELLQLCWLRDFESFRVRVTTAEQVSAVEVRGWDYRNKGQQEIVAMAPRKPELPPPPTLKDETGLNPVVPPPNLSTITETGFGAGSASSKFGKNPRPAKMIVVDQPVFTPAEADIMADALWQELGCEFVYADAQSPGNPNIRVGKVVELNNMGRYNGKYYITETRHLYHEGSYRTEFSVRGLRSGTLLSVLCPPHRLQPGQTFLVGIVTHNHDPEGLGRVRVRFPTLNPEKDGSGHSSQWARVVAIGAGPQRGWDWLPEINDEVVVGFEHGDIHRPYVFGGVWNGKHHPPEPIAHTVPAVGSDRGKVRLRTLKTRTGHTLQFIEEDQASSQAGVRLTTSKGHQVILNDSQQTITLTTPQNHQICLNDQASTITLQTKGGQTLVLSDTPNGIVLASSGNIVLQAAAGVVINPGLMGMTVQGTIQCQTLITGLGTVPLDVTQEIMRLNQSQAEAAQAMQEQNQRDLQQSQAIANLQTQVQASMTPSNASPSTNTQSSSTSSLSAFS